MITSQTALPEWRNAGIQDNLEPLVALQPTDRLIINSIYYRLGHLSALKGIYVRVTVAEKLYRITAKLPDGFTLIVLDGWRPLELQRNLYNFYRSQISYQHSLFGEELDQVARRFVAEPSDDPRCPSPHLTGGSVDVMLGDSRGRPLDMGAEYDELSSRLTAGYYEGPSGNEWHLLIKNRRRLLHSIMEQEDFTSNPNEFAHFDYGNQSWAAHFGVDAFYGMTSPKLGQLEEGETIDRKMLQISASSSYLLDLC